MADQTYRTEHDSMGELKVPADALWGAQTQRAVENFPVSHLRSPRAQIRALGLIKGTAAKVNLELDLLDEKRAKAIEKAAESVAAGEYDDHFPVDIFQTGSGTSTNMNANEVIAHLASRDDDIDVHPNDHVNMSQSSNDVIPTSIHLSAALQINEALKPALDHLAQTMEARSDELADVVKTGRTHLMDAMPVTFGQEISGWAKQIRNGIARLDGCAPRLDALPLGGTAVGTGINAPADFGRKFAAALAERTGIPFKTSDNYFESLSSQDAAVEVSGQLKVIAVSLMKIGNDLRWMNSGPLAGLAEIALPELQPGSSIMPGKVNPVIGESVVMLAAQAIGNDSTITVAGQAGNFQLNVMLPVTAHNLLQSIEILANGSRMLADKAIKGFTVNRERIDDAVEKNPILVTALNPVIGYELGARIAKRASKEARPVREVAAEMTDLSEEELNRLLDPLDLTRGGIKG
jgi:fumarate hydratase class II